MSHFWIRFFWREKTKQNETKQNKTKQSDQGGVPFHPTTVFRIFYLFRVGFLSFFFFFFFFLFPFFFAQRCNCHSLEYVSFDARKTDKQTNKQTNKQTKENHTKHTHTHTHKQKQFGPNVNFMSIRTLLISVNFDDSLENFQK